MERRGIFWIGVMLGLVVLAYVVPYLLLSGVDAWYGSFAFWLIFGLAAIGVNVIVTRNWRD